MSDGVIFYRSFYEAISQIDDPVLRAKAYDLIMEYALNGEVPGDDDQDVATIIFTMARPQIDANRKKSESGAKGGAPVGNTNAKKQPKQPMVVLEEQPKQAKYKYKDKYKYKEEREKEEEEKEEVQPRETVPVRLNDYLSEYPKKTNNIIQVSEAYVMELNSTQVSEDDLIQAVRNYAEAVRIQRTETRYIKNADRFIRDGTYLDYMPGTYKKPQMRSGAGKFGEVECREYDFDALEKSLTGDG